MHHLRSCSKLKAETPSGKDRRACGSEIIYIQIRYCELTPHAIAYYRGELSYEPHSKQKVTLLFLKTDKLTITNIQIGKEQPNRNKQYIQTNSSPPSDITKWVLISFSFLPSPPPLPAVFSSLSLSSRDLGHLHTGYGG